MQTLRATTITGKQLPQFWRYISNRLRTLAEGLRARFERTTSRERALIGILILGAALYAPIHCVDVLSTRSEAYYEALNDQSTARLTAQKARRMAASVTDAAALEDMKSWGIKATNSSIAQVMIEQKLLEAADSLGMTNVRIATQSKVDSQGPTHWMLAEVQTELRWGPAFNLLETIGEWPEGFRLESFRYEITPFQGLISAGQPIPDESGTIRFNLAFPVILDEMPGNSGSTLSSSTRVQP